jgi:hypothetical protein
MLKNPVVTWEKAHCSTNIKASSLMQFREREDVYFQNHAVHTSTLKLSTHLHLMSRSRMVELYLHSRIYLHGVAFN